MTKLNLLPIIVCSIVAIATATFAVNVPTCSVNNTMTVVKALPAFDTGSGTYPSIFGMHTGAIKPNQLIIVHKLYTYPCAGTGGHTEYVRIWNATWKGKEAYWKGYPEDWRNLTFDEPFTLFAEKTYYYEIRTGSYPQIIHESSKDAIAGAGTITCDKFIDANGKRYDDWIPAIRLE